MRGRFTKSGPNDSQIRFPRSFFLSVSYGRIPGFAAPARGKRRWMGATPPFSCPVRARGCGAIHICATPPGGVAPIQLVPTGRWKKRPMKWRNVAFVPGGAAAVIWRTGQGPLPGLGDNPVSDRIAVHEPMLHAVIQAGDDLAPSVAVWRPLIPFGVLDPCATRWRVHRNAAAPVTPPECYRRRAARVPVVEAALVKVVKNKVEATYRQADLFERRRRLMEDWESFLAGESRQPASVRLR